MNAFDLKKMTSADGTTRLGIVLPQSLEIVNFFIVVDEERLDFGESVAHLRELKDWKKQVRVKVGSSEEGKTFRYAVLSNLLIEDVEL